MLVARRVLLGLMLLAAAMLLLSAAKLNQPRLVPSGKVKIDYDALDSGSQKLCALTFDDGPDATYTMQVLHILDNYGVKGTFFFIGHRVPQYAKQVQAVAASGHEIGNHSYTHPNFRNLSAANQQKQLQQTNDALSQLGITAKWFRPPYGEFGQNAVKAATALGMETVTWSVDPLDWTEPGVDKIVSRVIKATTNGGVILLHTSNPQTPKALPQIIEKLQAKGYVFVTMSQWRDAVTGKLPKDEHGAWDLLPHDTFDLSEPLPVSTSESGAPRVEMLVSAPDGSGVAVEASLPAGAEGAGYTVYSNFANREGLKRVWAESKGASLRSFVLPPAPAPLMLAQATPATAWAEQPPEEERQPSRPAGENGETTAAGVTDTPVVPAADLPTLPEGEEMVFPPGTVPENTTPPVAAQPTPAAPETPPTAQPAAASIEPLTPAPPQAQPAMPPAGPHALMELQVIDLVDFDRPETLWQPTQTIDTANFLNQPQPKVGGRFLAEPKYYFISYVNNLEEYTWVELHNYVRLARLGGLVLPVEFNAMLPTAALPYPWITSSLGRTDRGGIVDLTVENIADVMEAVKRGKENIFVVVRPANLHFFIAAHTLAEMNSNMRDFVLFRQLTGGLNYDPDANLAEAWSLPAGVEIARFTDGQRETLVIYSQSYRTREIAVPDAWAHMSQATIDPGGYLRVAALAEPVVTMGRSPAILTYDYGTQ